MPAKDPTFLRSVVNFLKERIPAKQVEVATFFGINETYLSDMLNGRKEITDSFIENVSKFSNISNKFLVAGTGPMFNQPVETIELEFKKRVGTLQSYRAANENQAEAINHYKDKYIGLLESNVEGLKSHLEESVRLLRELKEQLEEHRSKTEVPMKHKGG